MENMAWSGIPLEAGLAKLPQGHQLSSVIHYTRLGRYHRAISSHQSFTTQGWEAVLILAAILDLVLVLVFRRKCILVLVTFSHFYPA